MYNIYKQQKIWLENHRKKYVVIIYQVEGQILANTFFPNYFLDLLHFCMTLDDPAYLGTRKPDTDTMVIRKKQHVEKIKRASDFSK